MISCFFATTLFAQQPLDLPVWGNGAPDNNAVQAAESFTKEGHALNSKEARMYVYLPQNSDTVMAAILVCPGGGYGRQAMQHEGHDVAKWLNSKGVAAVVLKYRLPNGHSAIPLEDAQEAMRVIRHHANDWKIDPRKVGVCGFSAGGHLASTLGTHNDSTSRPDFMVLFYPVISMKKGVTHNGSRTNLIGENPSQNLEKLYSNEAQVNRQTPSTFLILSDDDKTVPPLNSILFYNALKDSGVSASLHVFPSGGHGFGFRQNFTYHELMKQLLWDWIQIKIR